MIRLGVVAAEPAVRIADGTQASAGDLILCIRNDGRYPLRICSLKMSACPQCWASSRSTWRYTQRSGSGPRQ